MKIFISTLLVFWSISSFAQNQKTTLYNPDANAREELQLAISKASVEGKHVLIQIGGNWCPWCIKLHKFIHDSNELDSIISADYVFLLVNYSKENKNPEIMEELEYPQRFGFPALVVLDANGRRIHTQDTGFLEEGDGYSENKIKQFLLSWNTAALEPSHYAK
jgi:thioredoxin-related protein